MRTRFQNLLGAITGSLWHSPGAMVCCGVPGAVGLIGVGRGRRIPKAVLEGPWLLNGGGVSEDVRSAIKRLTSDIKFAKMSLGGGPIRVLLAEGGSC